MSTTAIIASGAVIAAQEAQRAQDVVICNGVIDRFDSFKATVVQMQEYAGCVNMIYPVDTSGGVIAAKIAVGLSFLFALIGVIYGKFFAGHWSVFRDGVLGAAFFGVAAGWLVMLIIGLAYFLVAG